MKHAPIHKTIQHQLKLFQPILLFMFLLSALVLLSRCSPLSPSTDRLDPADKIAAVGDNPQSLGSSLDPELLDKLSEDLSTNMATEISNTEYEKLIKQKGDQYILRWQFIPEKIPGLLEASRMSRLSPSDLFIDGDDEILIPKLKKLLADKKLKADIWIVTNSEQPNQDLRVRIRARLSIIKIDRALLLLERILPKFRDDANAKEVDHITSLRDAKFLAVVLHE